MEYSQEHYYTSIWNWMSKDDEDPNFEKSTTTNSRITSQLRSKQSLLRIRNSGLRYKQVERRWATSIVYPNVIIVKSWRFRMDNKKEMEKLQTAGQIICLTIHDTLVSFAAWVWSPVTLMMEQFNGTASFREVNKKLDNYLNKL